MQKREKYIIFVFSEGIYHATIENHNKNCYNNDGNLRAQNIANGYNTKIDYPKKKDIQNKDKKNGAQIPIGEKVNEFFLCQLLYKIIGSRRL